MTEHYHVVEFIDGFLNDYDSGPIATIEDARKALQASVDADNAYELEQDANLYVAAGDDRYERGMHILKIETCNENCDDTTGLRCASGTLLSMPCYDDNCDDNHNI
jgi:hypothetical protein